MNYNYILIALIFIGLFVLHLCKQENFQSDIPLSSVLRLEEVKKIAKASGKNENDTRNDTNVALTDSLKDQQPMI